MRCYDILKDIQRLESYVKREDITLGYSKVLTNEETLWKPKKGSKENHYDEIRVYDRRIATGKLNWKPGTSDGTKKGRAESLNLTGHYIFEWIKYSEVDPFKEPDLFRDNTLKYALTEIS